MIQILFFAQLREQLNCAQMEWAVSQPLSADDLRTALIQKNPAWEPFLNSKKILLAVNQSIVKGHHLVESGDEVAFFPPVTGG